MKKTKQDTEVTKEAQMEKGREDMRSKLRALARKSFKANMEKTELNLPLELKQEVLKYAERHDQYPHDALQFMLVEALEAEEASARKKNSRNS